MQITYIQSVKAQEYVDIFFRRKWLLIIPFICVFLGAIVVSRLLPKVYRATVKIEVLTSPLVSSYDMSETIRQQLGILRERIFSQSSLEQVVRKAGIDNKKDPEAANALIASLRKDVSITMAGNQLIMVSYDGSDKARIRHIVKIMANTIIEESFKKREEEASTAVDFISSELSYYKSKIKGGELEANRPNPLANRLKVKLFKLEDELSELMIDATPQHPRALILKKEIEDIKKELGSINGGKLPERSGASSELRLERKIRLSETLYNQLLSQLEIARISQRLKTEEERTKFRIIDLDRIPVHMIAPNRAKICMSGLMLGIIVGIGLISFVEVSDHSFKNIDDTRKYLGIPILGSISEALSDRKRGSREN